MTINNKTKDLIRSIPDSLLTLTAVSITDFYLSDKVADFVRDRLGFCFSHILPASAYPLLNRIVQVLTLPNEAIVALFDLNEQMDTVLVGPVVEEVEFRLLLQQVMLKHLPKHLLDMYFPDHRIDFDSPLSKGARILITATIFAILHFQAAQCESGGAIKQFLGGVLYSTLIETGSSVLTTMNLHVIFNGIAEHLSVSQ